MAGTKPYVYAYGKPKLVAEARLAAILQEEFNILRKLNRSQAEIQAGTIRRRVGVDTQVPALMVGNFIDVRHAMNVIGKLLMAKKPSETEREERVYRLSEDRRPKLVKAATPLGMAFNLR
ncbi:hypothetical protein NW762_007711 [Fusarium torreyae]|uniref:Uncharacterized protein n=1 Tax=Fusarium torreyae TaxID=1237075 RepID=A0A9W8RYT5_9HYPO|nr:hypothetical protein NW762_007711 [Fusarium torreyae]